MKLEDLVSTGLPPIGTQLLLWRNRWLIGEAFISPKGKLLFCDGTPGCVRVGPNSRWIELPNLK